MHPSRRQVLAAMGAATVGGLAGCSSVTDQSSNDIRSTVTELDHQDPRVEAAKTAEQAAYRHYDLEPQNHYVEIPDLGLRIRVAEIGTGPPVVLIPGGVGQGYEWLPFLPELRDYTIYVMDRPGGGLSDGLVHHPETLRREAVQSSAAMFDHFDLDEAPIVGNSMGGWWAIRFAHAHPDRVSDIALFGCPALYPGTSAPFPIRLITIPGLGQFIVQRAQPDNVEEARERLEGLGHPAETRNGLPREFHVVTYRMDNQPHYIRSALSLFKSTLRIRGARPDMALKPEDLGKIGSRVLLVWGAKRSVWEHRGGSKRSCAFPRG